MGCVENEKKVLRKQYIKSQFSQDLAFSLAVVADDLKSGIRTVYTAGITAIDAGNTLEAQLRETWRRIEIILNLAGGKLSDLNEMFTSIPGLDFEKRTLFVNIRREVLGGNNPQAANYPASMLTGTLLALDIALVEIKSSASFPTPKDWKIENNFIEF